MFAAASGNLSVFDWETGRPYITPGSYPCERRLHAALYRNFESANAVPRTHSPYAAAFAINNMEIPVALYEPARFLSGVPSGSPEVGEDCVKAIRDRNVWPPNGQLRRGGL